SLQFSVIIPDMQQRYGPYRIGIDARFFQRSTGGVGRYSREPIRHLMRLDTYNSYTAFLTPEGFAEWEFVQHNFKPVVVASPHYTWSEQTAFLRRLNAEKLDLVHFLNFNHPLLYRRPFVTTLHDLTILKFPQHGGRSSRSPVRRQAFLTVFRRSLKAA